MSELRGKRILFFAPSFFSYEKMIADEMVKMGAIVDSYDVRSVKSAFSRGLLKINPAIFSVQSKHYYNRILNENKKKNYDYILFIKCDMTPLSILRKLKVEYPNAKMCLYLYDSVSNIPGIERKFKYFDTLHSFDMGDCRRNHDLVFRPLFFGEQYEKDKKNNCCVKEKYDICFLGTIHSDRFSVIKRVQQIAKEKNLKSYWFLYLQSKLIYYYYKIVKQDFKGTSPSMFRFKKKTAEEISIITDMSRAVLDIQHPKQTGLTMRTIEMIGMRKKIITPNSSIKNIDFYNPNYIFII